MYKLIVSIILSLVSVVVASQEHLQISPTANVTFWNHTSNKAYSELFPTSSHYDLHVSKHSLSISLLRNIVWNEHKHMNGVVFSFEPKPIFLQTGQDVRIAVKLGQDSQLPNTDSLPKELNADNVEDKHYFSLLFYGPNHDRQDQKTYYVEYRFAMIPEQEVEFVWSLDDALVYSQLNWQKTPVDRQDVESVPFYGAILMAENNNYTTLENRIGQQALQKLHPQPLFILSKLQLKKLMVN